MDLADEEEAEGKDVALSTGEMASGDEGASGEGEADVQDGSRHRGR